MKYREEKRQVVQMVHYRNQARCWNQRNLRGEKWLSYLSDHVLAKYLFKVAYASEMDASTKLKPGTCVTTNKTQKTNNCQGLYFSPSSKFSL